MSRLFVVTVSVCMTNRGEVTAQAATLRGLELVGYHATAVNRANELCGGGEMSGALKKLINMRDVEFRFGMAQAVVE
jgi:hypothetical protein